MEWSTEDFNGLAGGGEFITDRLKLGKVIAYIKFHIIPVQLPGESEPTYHLFVGKRSGLFMVEKLDFLKSGSLDSLKSDADTILAVMQEIGVTPFVDRTIRFGIDFAMNNEHNKE